jgi:tRNA threonylcarbamoyladenosine biosynthesis protein TsaE
MPRESADHTEIAEMSSNNPRAPESVCIVDTCSSLETEELGERLGRACTGGEIIGLVGPLGAGKTCLTRGLARGLGIADGSPASPTFALIHEYRGRMPLVHVDLYRLDSDAAARLGLEEYLESSAVTVIEWADKILTLLPRDYLRIDLEHRGGDQRRLTFSPFSTSYQTLVQAAFGSARSRGTRSV